jgi:hypothetical protein
MTRDRFRNLAEAFGSDLRRWPGEVRSAAARFIEAEPGFASAILAREAALDEALDAVSLPAPSAELELRVLASAPARRAPGSLARLRAQSAWRPASGLAAAAAAGLLVGYFGMAAAAPASEAADLADLAGAVAWAIDDGDASPWSVE